MSPPVALLGWELGAGLGHARRLLAIARALRREGVLPVIAQRELWACADELRAEGIRQVQAPIHKSLAPRDGTFHARSYADMMAACGYARLHSLWPTVLGWDGLIDLVRPSVIVTDYAPILSLAAHGRVPVVAIGDGFVLPPTHLGRFPVLRDGEGMADEPAMLANAASVQARRGLPAPEALPALIGGQAHVVCTYRETDIYATSRQAPALGPLEPQPAPLPAAPDGAVFVYLAADYPHTAKLLQLVSDLRRPATAYVRDASEQLKGALRAAGVAVHDRPAPLPEALRAASLVVHHGGVGTIETCLAAGRPQFLLPRHFEQGLNAKALVRLGVARYLWGAFSLADGRAALSEAVASHELRAQAEAVAAELAGRETDSLEAIVAACRSLAA